MRVTVRSGYLLVKIKRYFVHSFSTPLSSPVAVTGAPTRFPTNQKQGEGVAGGEVGKDCPLDFLPSTGARLPAFMAAVTEASESRA